MELKLSLVEGDKREYSEKSLVEMFEKCVFAYEDKIAICYKEERITYGQLNKKVNQLASYISKKYTKKNTVIGIKMEKSSYYVFSILAVLKTGNAYLPVDVNLPSERVDYMIDECNVELILTDKIYDDCEKYNVSNITQQDVFIGNDENLNNIIGSNDLAYILYTSGTTGKPKGVMIENKGVINLIHWFGEKYNICSKNTILLSNIGFDVSVEEILGTLLMGGTLFIPPESILKHKNIFTDYIDKNAINIVQFVPAVMKNFLLDHDKLECIDAVICGGEQLDEQLKNKILEKGYKLYNHYGPTEITVDALSADCRKEDIVNVGMPIANTCIIVVDINGKLVSVGEIGEIYVGGQSVARGYINNAKQNELSFIRMPFKNEQIFYKTGDLGFMKQDGSLILCGRTDNQVKLRGNRIELDEIKECIKQIEQINDVAVVIRTTNNNDNIYAFYTLKEQLKINTLKEYLCKRLPKYMIPSFFIELVQMPLNLNCKTDLSLLKNGNISDIMQKLDKEVEVRSIKTGNYGQEEYIILKKLYELFGNEINFDDFIESTLVNIGFDSLTFVNAVVKIENYFDIQFDMEFLDISRFIYIKDLLNYISDKNLEKHEK